VNPAKTATATASIGVGIVAASAAIVSFYHVQKLARSAGEPEITAWLLPLSIDGAIAAAAAVILADSRANRRPTLLTWLMLCLGLGASLAANIASAEPTWTARAIAAWPPIALALGIEVLASIGRRAKLTPTEDANTGTTEAHEVPAGPATPTPATAPARSRRRRTEPLHLVPEPTSDDDSDAAAIARIRALDAESPDGPATRRSIQEALNCGASRATRLAALARQDPVRESA